MSKFHYNFYALLLGSLAMMSFTTEGKSRLAAGSSSFSDTLFQSKNLASLLPAAESVAVDFSGQAMNAEANAFAQNFIARQGNALVELSNHSTHTFDVYDEVLPQYGVPKEMKYLSVIESYLNPGCTSPMGAAGTWQLMPAEARRWGLSVGGRRDERRNLEKSTAAAAKFLHVLYEEFNDWLLVLAAYNAGPGRVRSAIRKSGKNDFWALQTFLPQETRNHVKKYIAVHYLLEGKGGETTFSAAETVALREAAAIVSNVDLATASISGRYLSAVMARLLDMSLNEFNRYNQQFDSRVGSGQPYTLRLPKDKMERFAQVKQQALAESVQSLLAQN